MTMATKQSKPRSRTRRNLPPPAANFEPLHELIELERESLMAAEAVLDCVIYAMEGNGRVDATGPRYARVVRIARRLVSTTIDHLDSVYVKAAMTTPTVRGTLDKCSEVNEPVPAYVH